MIIELLRQTPPWEWPPDAGQTLLAALRDRSKSADEREIAAHLAGDLVVMNDEMAEALVSIVDDRGETDNVRGAAAIALGPVLEQTHIEGFEDDGVSEPPILKATLERILAALRRVHDDADESTVVRRRALEASVRYPQDWHAEAIRIAYGSGQHDWQLTAVFGMQYVHGFEQDILASLASEDPELVFEAVRAAGAQSVAEAWPTIKALLTSAETDRDLLLAAIAASGTVAPKKAMPILSDLADSDDEEIAEAADDAMSIATGESF